MKITSHNAVVNTVYDTQKSNKSNVSNNQNAVSSRDVADKLEISESALKMSSVQTKLKSGFYDDPQIIRETAERLLQSLGDQV